VRTKTGLTGFVAASLVTAAQPNVATDASTIGRDGRLHVSAQTQQARITHLVQPVYPELARQTKISGTVRMHAIIGKDGAIKQLEAIDGHPLLQQAALNAVSQWRYQPTLANGQPVEVDTTISVNFTLSQQ